MTSQPAAADAQPAGIWTVTACIVAGLVVLVALTVLVPVVGLGAWLLLTTWHAVDICARPDGTARRRAVARGTVRTVLWLPLVAPFAVGTAVLAVVSLLGDLGV